MTKKLSGKVAIVTGASKGIGAAIAKKLAEEGAKVVVNYSSSKEAAERVVAEIKKSGGDAIAVQANVAEQADIKRLFSDTMKNYKRVDIVINNAGIYDFASIQEVTAEHFHKMFNLNVLGMLLVSQEAVNHFGPQGGSIVNISSLASTLSVENASVYSATKGAVDALTRSLSKELGPKKIRVNAINPGVVLTEGVHEKGIEDGEFRKNVERDTPLGRVGQPEDIAPAALFLVSDDSSWISGQTLVIAGGYH